MKEQQQSSPRHCIKRSLEHTYVSMTASHYEENFRILRIYKKKVIVQTSLGFLQNMASCCVCISWPVWKQRICSSNRHVSKQKHYLHTKREKHTVLLGHMLQLFIPTLCIAQLLLLCTMQLAQRARTFPQKN